MHVNGDVALHNIEKTTMAALHVETHRRKGRPYGK